MVEFGACLHEIRNQLPLPVDQLLLAQVQEFELVGRLLLLLQEVVRFGSVEENDVVPVCGGQSADVYDEPWVQPDVIEAQAGAGETAVQKRIPLDQVRTDLEIGMIAPATIAPGIEQVTLVVDQQAKRFRGRAELVLQVPGDLGRPTHVALPSSASMIISARRTSATSTSSPVFALVLKTPW